MAEGIALDGWHFVSTAPEWAHALVQGTTARMSYDAAAQARQDYMVWWASHGGCGVCHRACVSNSITPFCAACHDNRLMGRPTLTGMDLVQLRQKGVVPVWSSPGQEGPLFLRMEVLPHLARYAPPH